MEFSTYNVLIVEDEFIAYEYLNNILQTLGFRNIYYSDDWESTLNIIREIHIDLALMDININGALDGIQCAKIINKEYFIPIIYTTAYADKNTIKEATQSDVFSYLVKPFDFEDVEAAINVVFKVISKVNSSNEKENDKNSNVIKLNDIYIYNLETKTLTAKNSPITLTKKELELLDFFCANINQNISYNTLCEYVWFSKDISLSTIRDTVSRLKSKVDNLDIINIVDYGYILKTK